MRTIVVCFTSFSVQFAGGIIPRTHSSQFHKFCHRPKSAERDIVESPHSPIPDSFIGNFGRLCPNGMDSAAIQVVEVRSIFTASQPPIPLPSLFRIWCCYRILRYRPNRAGL